MASKDLQKERYDKCKSCEYYVKFTTQCKKCGCITKLKVTLDNQKCPIGKW